MQYKYKYKVNTKQIQIQGNHQMLSHFGDFSQHNSFMIPNKMITGNDDDDDDDDNYGNNYDNIIIFRCILYY